MKPLVLLCLPALALCGTFGGTVTDLSGVAVSGAVVAIGTDSTTTSSTGTWSLSRALGIASSRAATPVASSRLAIESGRLRVRFGGIDASGRVANAAMSQGAVPSVVARSAATTSADTIFIYWRGKRLVVLPVSSSDSSGIALKIDTAWSDDAGIPWNARIDYGSLKDDRDGHVYRTVTIGSQTWMAENLDYAVDSSWCDSTSMDFCAKYGRVYQWSAVMGLDANYNRVPWSGTLPHQGLCPGGWHVPGVAEWSTLVKYVDSATSGLRLRSTSGWSNSGNGMDVYGFRVLPAGYYYDSGPILQIGKYTYFWMASNDCGNDEAWSLDFSVSYAFVYRGRSWAIGGISARCLQN